jgi:arylsulfatase A-like enzyme
MDRQVGILLEAVRASKSDRPTLVFFMADNGPMPTFSQTRTPGLRGSKLSLYEGGIRVPLIAWWPNRIPAGRVDQTSVISALDIFPTLVEIAGAKLSRDVRPEGQTMATALFGKSVERTQPLFWEYGRNTNSFAYARGQNRSPNLAMREGKWKLFVQSNGTETALYDLEKDPNEKQNVAASNETVTEEMRGSLLEWRKALP